MESRLAMSFFLHFELTSDTFIILGTLDAGLFYIFAVFSAIESKSGVDMLNDKQLRTNEAKTDVALNQLSDWC